MKGYIHSFESFGTKDGPGIRFVLFLQGCPLRCLYCHNVDTWDLKNKKYMLTPEETMHEISKVRGFIKSGGLTVSGGEPLLQPEFILELFKLCREEKIHTAIDTSGYLLNDRIKEVLEEKGIKQTWLAEQLGKSYNMVNGYVQNRQQPRIEVLYEIAEILGVSVKELLIDNDIKKNKK